MDIAEAKRNRLLKEEVSSKSIQVSALRRLSFSLADAINCNASICHDAAGSLIKTLQTIKRYDCSSRS